MQRIVGRSLAVAIALLLPASAVHAETLALLNYETKPEKVVRFVQNSFLNLPGMSDGSITGIDVTKGEPIVTVGTLKNQGLNPNSIVLPPARP